jgi:hypothetical protein
MIDRQRHREQKELFSYRKRMHEQKYPQARLTEYASAIWRLKGVILDCEETRDASL